MSLSDFTPSTVATFDAKHKVSAGFSGGYYNYRANVSHHSGGKVALNIHLERTIHSIAKAKLPSGAYEYKPTSLVSLDISTVSNVNAAMSWLKDIVRFLEIIIDTPNTANDAYVAEVIRGGVGLKPSIQSTPYSDDPIGSDIVEFGKNVPPVRRPDDIDPEAWMRMEPDEKKAIMLYERERRKASMGEGVQKFLDI